MKETQVIIYTPESQLRSPRLLLRSMGRDLLASRELAWRLMVRDIKARYRQAALGILWAFLPPVFTALVFILLNRAAIINVGATDIPYPAFVMFGTVLWQLFTQSLNAPLASVTSAKSMLSKINFPREALILSGLGQVLFELGIRLFILAVVFAVFRLQPTWGLLLAPFAMLLLILLGITIGLLLIPVGMLYVDVTQGLAMVTAIWFFVTPVAYPPPEHGALSVVMSINPVSHLLVAARDLATLGTVSNIVPVVIVSAVAVVGLLVAWVLYRLSLPILIERMSA